MSRIGKLPISIPAGVTITLKDNVVTVKGPKGEMSQYWKIPDWLEKSKEIHRQIKPGCGRSMMKF